MLIQKKVSQSQPSIPASQHAWRGMYVRHAAFIQNADCFDAMLFGISGAEVGAHGCHAGMMVGGAVFLDESTSLLGKFYFPIFAYVRNRCECERVDLYITCMNMNMLRFEAWINLLPFPRELFRQICFTYWSMVNVTQWNSGQKTDRLVRD